MGVRHHFTYSECCGCSRQNQKILFEMLKEEKKWNYDGIHLKMKIAKALGGFLMLSFIYDFSPVFFRAGSVYRTHILFFRLLLNMCHKKIWNVPIYRIIKYLLSVCFWNIFQIFLFFLCENTSYTKAYFKFIEHNLYTKKTLTTFFRMQFYRKCPWNWCETS